MPTFFNRTASPKVSRTTSLMWRIHVLNACAHVTRPKEIDITKSGGPNEKLSLPKGELSSLDGYFPTKPVEISENTWPRGICHGNGIIHLTSHVLLFDNDMNLFVQMRDPARVHSGWKLAQSVGGHVDFERCHTPLKGAIEEAKEEAGVDISGTIEEIARYNYSSLGGLNREYVSLFLAQTESKVNPSRDEVYWMAPFALNDVYFLLGVRPELFSASFKEDLRFLMLTWGLRGQSNSKLLKSIRNLSADPILSSA